MTKLQNLYRAAIAADASVATVPNVSADENGQWWVYGIATNELTALLSIAEWYGYDCESVEHLDFDGVCDHLERIARKEASK